MSKANQTHRANNFHEGQGTDTALPMWGIAQSRYVQLKKGKIMVVMIIMFVWALVRARDRVLSPLSHVAGHSWRYTYSS